MAGTLVDLSLNPNEKLSPQVIKDIFLTYVSSCPRCGGLEADTAVLGSLVSAGIVKVKKKSIIENWKDKAKSIMAILSN